MRANWFIGLPVPAGPWFAALQPPAGVRLFGLEDLHVTVAFLGAVDEARARAAFELAQDFPLRALSVTLAQVEALGSRRRPSAFSALLGEGRAEVEHAMGATRGAMWERAAAREDTRPPIAHVTLARPERRANHVQREAALAWAKQLVLGAPRCQLTGIALYTWSADRSSDRSLALFRRVCVLPLRAG